MGMPKQYSFLVNCAVYGSSVPWKDDLPDWELQVLSRAEWSEKVDEQLYLQGKNSGFTPPQVLDIGKGWTLRTLPGTDKWTTGKFGKHGVVEATEIQKDGKTIYGMNCSEFHEVGEAEMIYFSSDRKALQEFASDMLPDAQIEQNVKIVFWQ